MPGTRLEDYAHPCPSAVQYEIELFKNVSAKLGWEPSMLEWSCMEWDEMRGHLKANDGVCDIAVAGAEVTSTDASDGIVFTWPTYR